MFDLTNYKHRIKMRISMHFTLSRSNIIIIDVVINAILFLIHFIEKIFSKRLLIFKRVGVKDIYVKAVVFISVILFFFGNQILLLNYLGACAPLGLRHISCR